MGFVNNRKERDYYIGWNEKCLHFTDVSCVSKKISI